MMSRCKGRVKKMRYTHWQHPWASATKEIGARLRSLSNIVHLKSITNYLVIFFCCTCKVVLQRAWLSRFCSVRWLQIWVQEEKVKCLFVLDHGQGKQQSQVIFVAQFRPGRNLALQQGNLPRTLSYHHLIFQFPSAIWPKSWDVVNIR